MIRIALALTLFFALAITLTIAAAQTQLYTLGDRCDWTAVTEIDAYDFDALRSFAVSLALVEGWRGDSFWQRDNTWNIPADAELRYQVTLRTTETWFTVSVLLAGDFAYVMAFDDYTPGTDVQHPCAAIRLPVAALGL